jgi:hypothetical protein
MRMTIEPDRIMTWRFSKAPKELRSLHRGVEPPEWLVTIPRALRGPDVDDIILADWPRESVTRHETPEGDLVYIGVGKVSKPVASRGRSIVENAAKATSGK